MKTVIALLLLNTAWLFLGALSIASLGQVILDLPPEMLPQWYLGLMTMAMLGAAIWLTGAAYQRLLEGSEPPTEASRTLLIADLLENSATAMDGVAAASELPELLDDHPAARRGLDAPALTAGLRARGRVRAQATEWVERDLAGLADFADRQFD